MAPNDITKIGKHHLSTLEMILLLEEHPYGSPSSLVMTSVMTNFVKAGNNNECNNAVASVAAPTNKPVSRSKAGAWLQN